VIVWVLALAGLTGVCAFGPTGAHCYTASPAQQFYAFPFEIERVESHYGAHCWEGHQRLLRSSWRTTATKSSRLMKPC
jgi:hypothetical protein